MAENQADVPRPVLLTALVVVLAAAVSAGIHAGLVPEHLGEMPLLGVSFIVAVLTLLAIDIGVAVRPQAQLPAALAALLFAALILAYAASRSTGLPVLEPEPEPVDAIGIVTIAAQFAGLLAALWLTRAAGGRRPVPSATPSLPHRSKSLLAAGLVAIAFTAVALGAGEEGHGHEEMHGHSELHHEAGPAAATIVE